ncbi:MAG: cysteine desulfurase [Vicinamibacteria bacterium]|nr:cysteine desulfurase [Vicinamibacteria bacterium]
MNRIYFDHNATTPLDPLVRAALVAALDEPAGNASSLHRFGQRARAAIDDARGDVAALVGGAPAEIVFTSGGTESDNFALRGALRAAEPSRRRLLFTAIEHHAVLNAAKALGREGFEVESVRVRPDGTCDLEDLGRKLDGRVALVTVMLVNNETGVIQPVAEAARLAKAQGALVHCDAVQAAGRVAIDAGALGVDTLALSAHKLHGPQGTGALWIRRGTRLVAWLAGGGQERNRRAGTENVAGIVGFGCAARLARERMGEDVPRIAALRDRLEAALLALPGARRNGDGPRVANTTNVSFDGTYAEGLLMALDLDGVAVSTGAACAAGAVEPSHVLRAMGLPPARVESSLRFSLGRGNTEADVDEAVAKLAKAVEKQRRR